MSLVTDSPIQVVPDSAAAPSLRLTRVRSTLENEPARQLEGLLRLRLRKCVALLGAVISEGDPDAVHDLRVWSRRLQQVIVALFPDSLPHEGQAMVKALRRIHRQLGPCRDCDVMIELLVLRMRRIRNREEMPAWETVKDFVQKRRKRRMERGRRKLASALLTALAHRRTKLAEGLPSHDGSPHSNTRPLLVNSVRKACEQWVEGLSLACERFNPANVHSFRIHTKRLRYRIELLADLGDAEAKTALASLWTQQDQLGRWHDQVTLRRLAAKALADPDFLIENPRALALRSLIATTRANSHGHARLVADLHRSTGQLPLSRWIEKLGRELSDQAATRAKFELVSEVQGSEVGSRGFACSLKRPGQALNRDGDLSNSRLTRRARTAYAPN
jgi:CHAD domain-containing protein